MGKENDIIIPALVIMGVFIGGMAGAYLAEASLPPSVRGLPSPVYINLLFRTFYTGAIIGIIAGALIGLLLALLLKQIGKVI